MGISWRKVHRDFIGKSDENENWTFSAERNRTVPSNERWSAAYIKRKDGEHVSKDSLGSFDDEKKAMNACNQQELRLIQARESQEKDHPKE